MNLPATWTTAPLGEIADSALGKMLDRAKRVRGTSLPYLRNINVRWGTFHLGDLQEMPFEAHELDRYGLLPGDVLVCEGGEPGRAAVWAGVDQNIKFQKAVHRVRPGVSLQAQWLVHHLRNDASNGDLEAYFSGTTIRHFTGVALSRYSVRLPPILEQRRIVAKLEALNEKSRRAKEALDAIPPLLERFRQSVLAAAFRGDLTAEWRAKNPDVEPADKLLQRIRTERRRRWEEAELAKMQAKGKTPGDDRWKEKYEEPEPLNTAELPELPHGWAWASIAQLLREDGLAYGILKPGDYDDNGVPMVRIMDIAHDSLKQAKFFRVSPALAQEFSRTRLELNDVLLSVMATIGRTVVVPAELVGANVNRALAVLKFVLPYQAAFMCSFFRSPFFRETFVEKQLGSAQTRINLGDVARFPVPIPPVDEVPAILSKVDAALGRMKIVREMVARCSSQQVTLDRSILAKAFRGDLVPQDPTDEPASVLLDRIRRERAAAELAKDKKSPKRPR